jgi:hypothetical protein
MSDWIEQTKDATDNPLLFLADDDIRFHLDFNKLYAGLDAYCFDGLASGVGILKLQSAVWHQGKFPTTLTKLAPGE